MLGHPITALIIKHLAQKSIHSHHGVLSNKVCVVQYQKWNTFWLLICHWRPNFLVTLYWNLAKNILVLQILENVTMLILDLFSVLLLKYWGFSFLKKCCIHVVPSFSFHFLWTSTLWIYKHTHTLHPPLPTCASDPYHLVTYHAPLPRPFLIPVLYFLIYLNDHPRTQPVRHGLAPSTSPGIRGPSSPSCLLPYLWTHGLSGMSFILSSLFFFFF